MNDRHAEFSSAEPDGYREAATLVVGKLAALIPLKDTIAATKNGQTFVDYFASAISAYDKQRALIKTLTDALDALALDVRDYPAWQRPCNALDLAHHALSAAKEITQ